MNLGRGKQPARPSRSPTPEGVDVVMLNSSSSEGQLGISQDPLDLTEVSFPGPAHHANRGSGAGPSQRSMLAEEDSGIDLTSFPDELDPHIRAQQEQQARTSARPAQAKSVKKDLSWLKGYQLVRTARTAEAAALQADVKPDIKPMVKSEVKPEGRGKAGSSSRQQPSKAAAHAAAAGAGDDGGIEVTAETQGITASYPHMRSQCAHFPFEQGNHEATCPLCYCMVCDAVASSCPCWDEGAGDQRPHCDAEDRDQYWQSQRAAAKQLREGGAGPSWSSQGAGVLAGASGPSSQPPRMPAPAQQQWAQFPGLGVPQQQGPLGGAPASLQQQPQQGSLQALAAAFMAGLNYLALPQLVPPQAGAGLQQPAPFFGAHPGVAGLPPQPLPAAGPTAADSGEEAEGADVDSEVQPAANGSVKGIVESLNNMGSLKEEEPPAGALQCCLHRYQRQSLGWMLKQEGNSKEAVRGGLLADEQGLGKTVQMLALIVSAPPTQEEAQRNLDKTLKSHERLELHPLGRAAREARAAAAQGRSLAAGGGSGGAGAAAAQEPSSSSGRASGGAGSSGAGSPAVKRGGENTAAAQGPSSSSSRASGGAGSSGAGPPAVKQEGKSGKKQATPMAQPCGMDDPDTCTCTLCQWWREDQAKREKVAKKAATTTKESPSGGRRKKRSAEVMLESCQAAAGAPSVSRAPSVPAVVSPGSSGVARQTLVVCPLSVVSQWHDEVRSKCPQLSVLIYHGANRMRCFPPPILASYDIVITTYNICAQENGPEGQPSVGVHRVYWHRVVLDEAHMIRNRSTRSSQAVQLLQSTKRWCLTGTPLVNQPDDVLALFQFLRHWPFSDPSIFNSRIRNKLQRMRKKGGGTKIPTRAELHDGTEHLRYALSLIMLRRCKGDLDEYGKPIVVLPPKTVDVVEHHFTAEESQDYLAIEGMMQVEFRRLARQLSDNYASILVLLVRLRQACIHPKLAKIERMELEAPDEGRAAANALGSERRRQLLAKLAAGGSDDCSICMDAPTSAVITACEHGPFCRDCIESHLQHQGGDTLEGTCPLCRAGLSIRKLFTEAQLKPPEPPAQKSKDEEALEDYGPSTKLTAALECIQQSAREDEAVGNSQVTKTILFSGFTSALDLMELHLNQAGVTFQRLDGRMRLSDRAEAVRSFSNDPKVTVLLASIKASALGLNLTCACRVIILDCWWNAALEMQAVDRCHRLGQTREVKVSKLIMKHLSGPHAKRSTVEQRIIQIQEEKKNMAEAALGDGDGARLRSRLGLADLQRLFGL